MFEGTFCFHLENCFYHEDILSSRRILPKHLDPSARRYCVATQKATISPFLRFAGVALRKACLLRKVFFVVLFACVIHDTSLMTVK